MNNYNKLNPLKHLKDDIPASIVVFLVAMPLCLGIALASGAPPFAGLISGIIGGIVVGAFSGSPLGVSGPAAGLAVIVLNAISDLGGFEILLVATIIAGMIQIIMGVARAGIIAYFFPSSVIQGMLAGIGIIIFLKQIPHAFGYDKDPEGDEAFLQPDGHNTFSELSYMWDGVSTGVMIISAVSLVILILWETKLFKKLKFTKYVQGPLVAVVVGIILYQLFKTKPALAIAPEHLVSIPQVSDISSFFGNFTLPDFSALKNPAIYTTAIVIAFVASLETLLCVEASDKQDELKRITPTNKELIAQGIGNMLAGFIGGLPVTQVIVRSSANAQSGGKTKASTIFHGILILVSVIAIPSILNMIPFGVLAAILLVVGYKLAKPALFKKMWSQGLSQFIPFVVTIIGIVFTDLLVGIALGLAVAIFIILKNNFSSPLEVVSEKNSADKDVTGYIKIELSEDVTFLNKASLLKTLDAIPDNNKVVIDASRTQFIHLDALEIIENFIISAPGRNLEVETIELYDHKESLPISHFSLSKKKVE